MRNSSSTLRRGILRLPLLLALAAVALAACGAPSTGAHGNLPHLTLGLTYIPDIQFAPFYVAAAKGYYADAGIDVSFHHGIETNEFAAIAAGQEDAIYAGGDELLEARAASGLPLVDVATVFQKYPVALVVPADSPIHSVADLRGHTIGIPGHYGATYTGLLALLHSGGLTEKDVTVQDIGFTQVAALLGHKLDAVMDYSNNGPVQLQRQGFAVRTLEVWRVQPLVSDGLVVLKSMLQNHPDEVRALVSATLRGVQYTIDHPQEAVSLSAGYVSDLNQPDQAAQALAVLQATIPLWQSAGKLGYNDPGTWQSMTTFLQGAGLLQGTTDVTTAYTNDYLPA
ncbi:MAG TPA: ABC transporter substrate-binding protein [Ktedonobacterales bacterium]|jgi:NitT/TauT family transport system substrate-binding protein